MITFCCETCNLDYSPTVLEPYLYKYQIDFRNTEVKYLLLVHFIVTLLFTIEFNLGL